MSLIDYIWPLGGGGTLKHAVRHTTMTYNCFIKLLSLVCYQTVACLQTQQMRTKLKETVKVKGAEHEGGRRRTPGSPPRFQELH